MSAKTASTKSSKNGQVQKAKKGQHQSKGNSTTGGRREGNSVQRADTKRAPNGARQSKRGENRAAPRSSDRAQKAKPNHSPRTVITSKPASDKPVSREGSVRRSKAHAGGKPIDYDIMTSFNLARAFVSDVHLPLDIKRDLQSLVRGKDYAALSRVRQGFGVSPATPTFPLFLQLEAMFKKNISFGTDTGRASAALRKFHEAEADCQKTNRRIERLIESLGASNPRDFLCRVRAGDWQACSDLTEQDRTFLSILPRVCDNMHRIHGDFRAFRNQMPDLMRLTAGSSADTPRARAQIWRKLTHNPVDVGRHLVSKVTGWAEHLLGVFNLRVNQRDYDRLLTVRKQWDIDRTITPVPVGNLPPQLAYDAWMKMRLLDECGIDLRDQSVNQMMSACYDYATIDMVSASDLIALMIVVLAVCEIDEWLGFLMDTRSIGYEDARSGRGRYAKYAAMGNGVTFGLETALFWSIIEATCTHDGPRLAYGDDLIVPAEDAVSVMRALESFGCQVNSEKSHFNGPYRESCGDHWYNGEYVTPQYIRRHPTTPSEAAHFINQVGRIVGYVCHVTDTRDAAATATGRYYMSLLKAAKGIRRVPYNTSTTSGIWVLPTRATQTGVLNRPQRTLKPITQESALEFARIRSKGSDVPRAKWPSLTSGSDYQADAYRAYVTVPRQINASRHPGALMQWYHDARNREQILGHGINSVLGGVVTSTAGGEDKTVTRLVQYVPVDVVPGFLFYLEALHSAIEGSKLTNAVS